MPAEITGWQQGSSTSLVPSLEEAERVLAALPAGCRGEGGWVATSPPLAAAAAAGEEEQEQEQGEGAAAGGGGGAGAGGRPPPPPPRLLAVDCEMVRTGRGLEVARATVVDENKEILLDCYVKPYVPILDYATQYSGIDESTLEHIDTRIEQLQVALLRLITPSTILIGHSIENDLKALKLLHLRCMDTSVMFPHPKGPPMRCSLRVLAKKFLKQSIQSSASGHNSVEDATATLDLALLKVARGPAFGVKGARHGVLDALGGRARAHDGGAPAFRCAALGPRAWLARHAARGSTHAIVAEDWGALTKNICKQISLELPDSTNHVYFALAPDDNELSVSAGNRSYGNTSGLEKKQKQENSCDDNGDKDAKDESCGTDKSLNGGENKESVPIDGSGTAGLIEGISPGAMAVLGSRGEAEGTENSFPAAAAAAALADALWAAAPPGTLVVAATQRPGLAAAHALRRRKRACQDPRAASAWGAEQEAQLGAAVDSARHGALYLAAK